MGRHLFEIIELTMRGHLILALFISTAICTVNAAVAQTVSGTTTPMAPAKSACDGPAYHVLDFWIGDWDVFDRTDGTKAGRSSIHKILNDCAVEVDWIGVEGEHVKELFYYYKQKQQWIQVWIGDGGATKQRHLLEHLADGSLQFQGEVAQMDGGSHLDRSTVTPLLSGNVHQIIDTSSDGKLWQVRFDAEYRHYAGKP